MLLLAMWNAGNLSGKDSSSNAISGGSFHVEEQARSKAVGLAQRTGVVAPIILPVATDDTADYEASKLARSERINNRIM